MSPRFLTIAVIAAASAATIAGCTYYQRGMPPSRESGRVAEARVPEARVTGPTVSCIPINQFSETRVRDGQTIDFLSSSRRGWRNTLPDNCPGLASERRFTYATSLSQLCSTDIIRVLVSSGGQLSPTGACGLGQFTPIELVR